MNPDNPWPSIFDTLYTYPMGAPPLPEDESAFKKVEPPKDAPPKQGLGESLTFSDEAQKYISADLSALQKAIVDKYAPKPEKPLHDPAHTWAKHINFAKHYGMGFNKISDSIEQTTTSLKSLAASIEGVEVAQPWETADAKQIIKNILAVKKQWQGHENNMATDTPAYSLHVEEGTVKVKADDGNYYTVKLAEGAGFSMAAIPNVKFTINVGTGVYTASGSVAPPKNTSGWQILGHTVGNDGTGIPAGQPVYFGPAVTVPKTDPVETDDKPKVSAHNDGDSLFVVGVETVAEAIPLLAEFIKDSLYTEEWKSRLLNAPDDTMYVRRADQKKYPDPEDWPYVMEEDEKIDPSTHQKVFVWD